MAPPLLLTPTPAGLYCPAGDFHIDPVRAVPRALITHGHSDHARAGHGAVLATQETLDIMRLRYGDHFAGSTQIIRYGETVTLNGVVDSEATKERAEKVARSVEGVATVKNNLKVKGKG